MNTCTNILFFGVSVRSVFSSRPQYAIRGTGILGQIAWFECRLQGAAQITLALPFPFSTLPRRRERGRIPSESKSCKNIACQGGIPEIFWLYLHVCSAWMILQDWLHSQTVISCYCNGSKFAVAYSRAFILRDVCRARAFDCFFL